MSLFGIPQMTAENCLKCSNFLGCMEAGIGVNANGVTDIYTAAGAWRHSAMRPEPIPIVFVSVSDPVGQGFVSDLARPGGNITGFTAFEFSMGGKWIEILKELAPKLARGFKKCRH